MTDIVSKEQRSKMMSGIRGKNTKPELLIRQGLFALGFRYRIHEQRLYGKPDLVFAKYKTVIFVHGCFWHGHNCRLFKLPSTNTIFWKDKIAKNQLNDQKNISLLVDSGWKVVLVWECALKGKKTIVSPLIKELAEIIKASPGRSLYELTALNS